MSAVGGVRNSCDSCNSWFSGEDGNRGLGTWSEIGFIFFLVENVVNLKTKGKFAI